MITRVPDGKVCLNDSGELAVTKFAVEPVSSPSQHHVQPLTPIKVWYLPGVAERFGIGLYSFFFYGGQTDY